MDACGILIVYLNIRFLTQPTDRLSLTSKLLYATVVLGEASFSKNVMIQITGLIIQALWSRDSTDQII